jgi:pimeloyl-ACP methyl ester carboxylesterase
MSRREDVAFASATDTCAAWLYRPEGVSGPAPCVAMAHGFSATRADGLPAYAERFAAAGMAVLLFDYRHFGDSTGEPRQLVDIGRQHDDYRAAIAFARTLGGIDAQRIALFGTSFSGGHVVVVAAKDPSLRAVVAQAPFADGLATVASVPPRNALRWMLLGLADQAAALAGRSPRLMPAVGPAGNFAAMTAPEAKAGFEAIVPADSRWRNEVPARIMLRRATYRPVRSAPAVACPLLVCVCERDATAPPGAAVKMAERAPRGEVARFPVGHFDLFVGEHFERAVALQTEFLQRHLARVAPAAAVG